MGSSVDRPLEAPSINLHGVLVCHSLGDDMTDEDAFMELEGKGLSVLVNTLLRPTAADVWIKPPIELIMFLRRWSDACRR